MTAVRGAIALANHHMRMKHQLAVKGKDFHLLPYRNLLIILLFSIEEAKRDLAECTNGRERRSPPGLF
jgi:hypothetical protein